MAAAEGAMIYAEVLAAQSNWWAPPVLVVQMSSALALLVLYNQGLKHIGDIWVVSVASVSSVVIAEPLIVYYLTRQAPGGRQVVGMLLAGAAVVISGGKS
jgi:hypothetical protein